MPTQRRLKRINPPVIYKSINGDVPPAKGEGIRLALYQPGERQVGSRKAMSFNLDILRKGVGLAKEQNAQVLVLGELFLSGYTLVKEEVPDVAIERNDPFLSEISGIADTHDIAIVCPFAEKEVLPNGEVKYYEASVVFDNNGKAIHFYRKNHLWGAGETEKWTYPYVNNPEDAYEVFMINGMRLGLLICYEVEFPEMMRIYTLKGANVVLVPTACLVGDRDQDGQWSDWGCNDVSKNLIPAHSYFNQIFVAYVNHALWEYKDDGTTLNGVYMGNSSVGDPYGRLLAASDNVESLLVVDCLPQNYGPTQVHNEAEYIRDRRPQLYGKLVDSNVLHPDGTAIHYPEDPNRG